MGILRSLSSVVTVHSDLEGGGETLDIHHVEADSRIYVRLNPMGAGLKLEFLVKPFPKGTHYYRPGSGGEKLISRLKGKPFQTARNLEGERQKVRELLAFCPTLEQMDDNSGVWLFDQMEEALPGILELQNLGDGILWEWPEGEKITVRPDISFPQLNLKIKGDKNDWLALSGDLKIHRGLTLSLAKLLEAVSGSHSNFIRVKDGEYAVLDHVFRARLEDLGALSMSVGKQVRLHPLAALAMENFWEQLPALKGDNGWEALGQRMESARQYRPAVPSTLQADLRDYQETGFRWLSRLAHLGMGACLADDMGLGKTLQALAVILQRAPQGPTLVVAPKSVCFNWVREAHRFAPSLKPVIFGETDSAGPSAGGGGERGKRRQLMDDLGPFSVVVCTYGLLQRELGLLVGPHWTTIVLDEAQAIKNTGTLTSKAAMRLKGDFKMMTTGTPIENHLGELWNLFEFINRGLLGSLKQFNETYAMPIRNDNDGDARRRLRKLISPFILRRRKHEVLDELPEKTETLLTVVPGDEEVAFYEALREKALKRVKGIGGPDHKRRFKILAEIMTLRRAACHPRLVLPEATFGGAKLAMLAELVEELRENRHKALIFSQFVDHLSLIREYLDNEGISYQYLDGQVPLKDRRERVDAFQAGEGDFFLISLKAGGVGLNLTAANYVIHMDPWWNPAVEDQASDRAHRIGQQQPVTIYRLVSRGSIEEKILELHKNKRHLADSLLEGTDTSAGLSVDEMMELMRGR